MYLHSYYWQELTIALIIVAPRWPSSMFRVVLSSSYFDFDSSFQAALVISTPCVGVL